MRQYLGRYGSHLRKVGDEPSRRERDSIVRTSGLFSEKLLGQHVMGFLVDRVPRGMNVFLPGAGAPGFEVFMLLDAILLRMAIRELVEDAINRWKR